LKRSAKRRRPLESTAEEYPTGLIADDEGGAVKPYPKEKHIGPIDPDASTLNQFLNSFRRATANVLVDGGKVLGKILAHCGTHCTGRATGSRQPGGRPRT